MNIALHGMESYITNELGKRNQIKVIRYADDFVIFGKTLKDVQKAKQLMSKFFKPIGLNLSEAKTRIGHSMEKKPGASEPIGLDFLSFHFRNIKCSPHRGVKNTKGVTQSFRLITMPSRKAVTVHKKALSRILVDYKNAPLGSVIERLASRIKGWTWYHSITQSTRTFSKMDEWLHKKLWRWAKRRYRTAKKAKQKCFSVKGWNFGFIDQNEKQFILDRHDKTRVRKFVKIKSGASFYDGNLVYFAKRLSLTNVRIRTLTNLFCKQKYKCFHCQLLLTQNDVIELHHVLDSNGEQNGKIAFVHGALSRSNTLK
jgi:RNA-directed DNA polymerase